MDRNHGNLVWSYDCMVLRVYPDRILQRRALISDYTYAPNPSYGYYDLLPPKYSTPTDQLDLTTAIDPIDPITCEERYNTNGY